ncbi:hypothetical protein O9G_004423 [Rozella allomycis CSF55]|uniref:Amino acid transporter transmembrane domain-containing protein n=1 Tax=Rozella allomycis (strain CSF55) TaxID=988480 RepID=A0A075AUD5_ROZAC|nr:hypothetical protein O9G_004423 [Rozella allomycis CSF55]|eukprot:EPZ33775.1 hypothetical protein O9G_004423 [Rozella allomycis CSF55]
MAFALTGYIAFGKDVAGNVLNNFPAGDSFIIAARMLLAVDMMVVFPTQFYPTRTAIMEVVRTRSRVVVSLVLWATVVGVSCIVHDLGSTFELVGIVASTCIAYVLPGLCYIFAVREKLTQPCNDELENERLLVHCHTGSSDNMLEAKTFADGHIGNNKILYGGSIFIVIFGIGTIVIGIITFILKLMK